MTKLLTDAGTAWILQQILPEGKGELQKIIDEFKYAIAHPQYGKRNLTIQGSCFPPDLKVKKIKMDLEQKTPEHDPFILATVDFGKGVRWRRGSLRIANVTIPESLKIAIKGKRVRDIVEGAPFPDFTIRNIIEDKSFKGNTLRIMCNESAKVPIN